MALVCTKKMTPDFNFGYKLRENILALYHLYLIFIEIESHLIFN